MEVDVTSEWRLDTELSFDRTIDRHRVHRAAVAEVFLTDVRALDEQRIVAASQLPIDHSYFGDHTQQLPVVDPLLVMEVGRQASLAGAHESGVPNGAAMISEDFDLRIIDPGALRIGAAPVELLLDCVFTWTRVRRGRLRAGVCEQAIFRDGQLVASHRTTGQILTKNELDALRTAQRGTPAPWTADLVDVPDPAAVPSGLVGRCNPHNVVLADLRRGRDELAARVAPRWSNRALFDHSYDHLTMQILTEAARQLALTGVDDGSGVALRDWQVTGLTGTFSRFAELDAVVTVRASIPVPSDGELVVPVTVEQDGQSIATVEVALVLGGLR
ncbi:AfsA-related hotdog domain-containing protein [Nocardia pseudovaccinii]|uniref:AfsA-related hotdog domain-containing protein n=1 Tax=Nocardia pseudovaccinii TaxID=189540 RepID=UPI003D8B53B0